MNGLSIRDLDKFEFDPHENDGFFSMKSTFNGARDSLFAIAVASCAAPKPMQTRSYKGVGCAMDETGAAFMVLLVSSVEVIVCGR